LIQSCSKKIRYDQDFKDAKLKKIEEKLQKEIANAADNNSGHCFCLFDVPNTCVDVLKAIRYAYITKVELKKEKPMCKR
jgi:hypothetical protein